MFIILKKNVAQFGTIHCFVTNTTQYPYKIFNTFWENDACDLQSALKEGNLFVQPV